MRSFVLGLLLVGVAYATSPSTEYLPPVSGSYGAPSIQRQSIAAPSNEYLPPSASNTHTSFAPAPVSVSHASFSSASFAPAPQATASHASFASAPSREYLAPAHSAPQANFAPQPIAQPPAFTPAASEPLPAHSLSSDGYRYRTVRRRYRHRRAAPSNDYLPPLASEQHETFAASPSQQSSTIIAPPGVSAEAKLENRVVSTMEDSYAAAPSGAVAQSVEPAHSLESDGYHYKTVKRYRLRRRY